MHFSENRVNEGHQEEERLLIASFVKRMNGMSAKDYRSLEPA